ncbi:MAG TPA: sugar phosphate isomerase/epimerase family protein [Phycisphaerae bacterium]|nr:sugar phosphate isomerase/epimerase family protein [Phycisphaerae bacterium]
MRISLIPDEYTNDPATGFELGRRWGVEHFEIRYAYRFRVPVGPAWAADRVAAAVKRYGVTVTAISPGLFKPVMNTDGAKVPLTTETPEEIRRHLDVLLPEFFAFAERLGTRNIVVFALPRSPEQAEMPAVVVESLAEAAGRAETEGFQLLLENGGGSWADTGAGTARLLEAVGSDALRLTWDPANAARADRAVDPVADGYPLVRGKVGNVHVKDMAVRDGKGVWIMMGDGVIDWPAQLAALAADGYDGCLTMESHLQYEPGEDVNLVARMEEFLGRVRGMM